MHIHTYFLTLAEDADEAKSNVESFIEDRFEKEFFDYGGLEETEESKLVSSVNDVCIDLRESKFFTENDLLESIRKEIEQWKASGNRTMEGYAHKRYGEILMESFCADMPFFNIENWDWSIPTKVPEEAEGCQWFAVKVDLHY